MSARKMLVVVLDKTKSVLGAATRRTAGVPVVADLVGTGLLVRMKDEDATVLVPADELIVKEVDYIEAVVTQPFGHVLDASGTVVTPSLKVTSLNYTASKVMVTVSPAPPADKTVLVVIDGGANHPPLKFVGKTAAGVNPTELPAPGVPAGEHLILATVDGHAALTVAHTF